MAYQGIADPNRGAILDLLAQRRSRYAFSSRPVEPEKLRRLFEAARWAPSSYNDQPWGFLVATRGEPERYVRLLGVLAKLNQQWAQYAPVLAIAVARQDFAHNGQSNRHALYDLGQAVANLTVQATALGLAVHQMGGFDIDQARHSFRLPDGHEPVAVMAIGYPGDPKVLPEALRQRETAPRRRRPLVEFVFSGTWGEPSPLVRDGTPERKNP